MRRAVYNRSSGFDQVVWRFVSGTCCADCVIGLEGYSRQSASAVFEEASDYEPQEDKVEGETDA